MKPLSVKTLTEIVGGKLIQGSDEVLIQYGAYRLKQVKKPNTAFFINKRIVNWSIFESQAPLILVTDWPYRKNEIPDQIVVINVENMEDAYWRFVDFYRGQFRIPIIAITGTTGKTTTKEMLKHILSVDKKVTATTLSSNSRTASLHYLLSIEEDTEAAVFETAVGAPGDVLTAGRYFKPTIGIITNIGAHHLNYCKTLEGYIQAKGEMLEIIDPAGSLILNADDVNTKQIDLSKFKGKIVKIGKSATCDFRASHIRYGEKGMEFYLHHDMASYEVIVPGYGEHQVYNALAAIAAASEMGMAIHIAANRLQTYKQLNKQLQLFKGLNHSILIDDTWSITTTSLEAALQVLRSLSKGKKSVAIIGTITDLGSWGYTIHEQAGELIHNIGVDVLITIGQHATIIADHALKLGFKGQVYAFYSNVLVYQLLEKIVDENTVVLIKGDMYSKQIHDLAEDLIYKPTFPSE